MQVEGTAGTPLRAYLCCARYCILYCCCPFWQNKQQQNEEGVKGIARVWPRIRKVLYSATIFVGNLEDPIVTLSSQCPATLVLDPPPTKASSSYLVLTLVLTLHTGGGDHILVNHMYV